MKIIEKAKSSLTNQLPFVLYAKPNSNQLNAFFQQNDLLYDFLNQKGFVFVSFDGASKVVLPKEYSEFYVENIQLKKETATKKIAITTTLAEKKAFEHLVYQSVTAIKTGAFEKIVVSRKIDFTNEIDVLETFKKILSSYSSAFRYLFFHPKVGLWMGATPEQLLKFKGKSFETVALAGTQIYSEDIKWLNKEIEEQKFVTDYIVSNCKQFASHLEVSKPETIQAGNLAHLKTIITGTIDKDNEVALINSLHPTPAVCGLPKDKAKNFILKNEGYQRKFYAGYLGEWKIDDTCDLFVNLRCMEVGSTHSIYVGCGITKESNAEKEFIETENKSETMRKIVVEKS